jgi:hypothetical protein
MDRLEDTDLGSKLINVPDKSCDKAYGSEVVASWPVIWWLFA